jgi:hypothetical protein
MMMGEDVLIFAVLTTGAVLIVSHLGRLYRTSVQHRTIREAISRDNASVPALLADLRSRSRQPRMTIAPHSC